MFGIAHHFKIYFIIILQISLLLHYTHCYPNALFKEVVNFIPFDDCPRDSLCENPSGYPQQFIRTALMRKRGFYNISSQFRPQLMSHNIRGSQMENSSNAPPEILRPKAGVLLRTSVYASPPALNLKEIEHNNFPVTNVSSYGKQSDFAFNSPLPELCSAMVRTIRPKSGTTMYSEKLFIINEEEILTQEIDIQICSSSVEEAECKYIEILGLKAVCRQKYITKELIALSRDGKLRPEGFKIPSSCCCELIDI